MSAFFPLRVTAQAEIQTWAVDYGQGPRWGWAVIVMGHEIASSARNERKEDSEAAAVRVAKREARSWAKELAR